MGFVTTGKLEFKSLADSILADITRMAVRQAITAPIAGAMQGSFAGGFAATLHDGGVVGETVSPVRYVGPETFEHAPRYHPGEFADFGPLPDEVPIIARRGELVVPPERVVREEKSAREQRPINVVIKSPRPTPTPSARARGRSQPSWRAPSIVRAAIDDEVSERGSLLNERFAMAV